VVIVDHKARFLRHWYKPLDLINGRDVNVNLTPNGESHPTLSFFFF
jgi:hypothetical protein